MPDPGSPPPSAAEVEQLLDVYLECRADFAEVGNSARQSAIDARAALLAAVSRLVRAKEEAERELAVAVALLRKDDDIDDDLVGLSLVWIGGDELLDQFSAWYKPEDWPFGRHRAASAFLRERLAGAEQRGREQGIEEAAKVCESRSLSHSDYAQQHHGHGWAASGEADKCAMAIRALRRAATEPGEGT